MEKSQLCSEESSYHHTHRFDEQLPISHIRVRTVIGVVLKLPVLGIKVEINLL